MSLTYQAASYSHTGMVRPLNEDACLALSERGLWVVADGMGGHAAGDYVSSLIVDALRGVPPLAELTAYGDALALRLQDINAEVREETARRGVQVMGSTVVVLAVREDQGECIWAGDSRLYRLRDGVLQSLSSDHSYVQELIDNGLLNEAQARVHPRANIVTRAIGVEDRLNLSRVTVQILPGDTFLLCSDGLNKTAEDHEIRGVLGHPNPYEVVRSLVHLGLTRGAPDNITAIVVKAS